MIVRQSVLGNDSIPERTESYFARFTIWVHMAHCVAKTLHLRPSEILDNWGCAELMVAFGQYQNEEAYKNWLSWDHIYGSGKSRKGPPERPKKYIVEFIDG